MKHKKEIDSMFDELVEKLKEVLPDYGKYLVVDGKVMETYAKWKADRDALG